MTDKPYPLMPTWFARHAPPKALFFLFLFGLAAAGPLPGAAPQDNGGFPSETEFIRENDAAMTKMMAGMEVKPSGDVDQDFAAMMIPHHQGAIDMAVAELRYGHNEQLRRIAQEIIVDQQQEIAAMRLALGQPLPPSDPAPTQGASGAMSNAMMSHHHANSEGNQQ